MALELLAAAGPGINDVKMYDWLDNGVTNWSVVTSPAPVQGNYRFKYTGGTTNIVLRVSDDLAGFAAKAYQWLPLRSFRLDGTLTSGQTSVRFLRRGANVYLRWRYVTASTYNIGIALLSTVVWGSTAFSTGVDYAIRAQFENGRAELWVDGVSEVTSSSGNWTEANSTIDLYGSGVVGQDQYWENPLSVQSDSESDRPGTDVWIDIITPNGDTGGSYDGFGSDSNCDAGDTSGTYTKWDDYAAGGTPDDSDYMCEHASEGDAQASSLTTVSPSGTTLGVIWRARGRANITGKIVGTSALMLDSDGTPNEAEVGFASNLLDLPWRAMCAVFDIEPGGSGTWDIPNLQAGVRSSGVGGANDEWSALALEVVGVDSDPPTGAPAADRRRLAQVV